MQVYSNKGREFGMQTKVKKQKMKSSLGDKIFVIINTVICKCILLNIHLHIIFVTLS